MLARQRDLEEVRSKLTRWLQNKMPDAHALSVSRLKQPGAGLSNETYLFDLSWRVRDASHMQPFVVRLQPTGFQIFPAYDLWAQFRIMECLAAADIPVPTVRWFENDSSILGCPFYVMEKTEGVIPSEVPTYHAFGLFRDATQERRAAMWWSGIETLVRIHRLDWRRLGVSFLGDPGHGTQPLDRQLEYQERYLKWVRGDTPQPILDAALAWLKQNRFAPKRVALCWGDSRLPNMIFRDDRVVAVLDWEMAFLGDPEADLGWWLFMDWTAREGSGIPCLEGFPSTIETIRRYEELAESAVEHGFYYEVFAALRYGIILARIAQRLRELDTPIPGDFETNNVCTQNLARLLGLQPPGATHGITRVAESTVHVQFHLTGPTGCDWYVVAEKGTATRHEGRTPSPDVTLTISADDWHAIESGELGRTEAFLGGRMKIEGDVSILMQLEDAISKLSQGQTGQG
jgi:aminoglycoside phosphotransferase (APT) family kinase protein/putative sterol carrier protein